MHAPHDQGHPPGQLQRVGRVGDDEVDEPVTSSIAASVPVRRTSRSLREESSGQDVVHGACAKLHDLVFARLRSVMPITAKRRQRLTTSKVMVFQRQPDV
jgi:hypothetical protein